jgi:uncharacterized cupin superfamily protein
MPFDNVTNLDSLELEAVGEQDYRGAVAYISRKLGSWHLGFHLEVLDPGNFSCPYHFHHAEEELFLVLDGRATLRQNDEYRHVGPGDLVFSPLGAEYAHQFYNHTDAPFRFLAISNLAQWDVCEYPDSGKLSVRGRAKMFEVDAAVDYWKGETEPHARWPDEILAGRLPRP